MFRRWSVSILSFSCFHYYFNFFSSSSTSSFFFFLFSSSSSTISFSPLFLISIVRFLNCMKRLQRDRQGERERERALSPPPIEMDPESTQERCGRMSGRGQGESVARCAEVQRASLAPSPPPPHSHHHGGHHGCHYHLGGMSSSGLRS